MRAQRAPAKFLNVFWQEYFDLVQKTCYLDFHRVSPALPEKIGMDDWEKRDQLLNIAQKENLDDTFKWIEADLS